MNEEENIMKAEGMIGAYKKSISEQVRDVYVKGGIEALRDSMKFAEALKVDELDVGEIEFYRIVNEFHREVLAKRIRPIKHVQDDIKNGKIVP